VLVLPFSEEVVDYRDEEHIIGATVKKEEVKNETYILVRTGEPAIHKHTLYLLTQTAPRYLLRSIDDPTSRQVASLCGSVVSGFGSGSNPDKSHFTTSSMTCYLIKWSDSTMIRRPRSYRN